MHRNKLSKKEYTKTQGKMSKVVLTDIAEDTMSHFKSIELRFPKEFESCLTGSTYINSSSVGHTAAATSTVVKTQRIAGQKHTSDSMNGHTSTSAVAKTQSSSGTGSGMQSKCSGVKQDSGTVQSDATAGNVQSNTTAPTASQVVDTKTATVVASTVDAKVKATTVQVISSDTINCAQKLKSYGFNPLVLNMASNYQPGGGFLKGSSAQEEELMRRSTYYAALSQPRIKKLYPLQPGSCIYTPNVIVFRHDRENGYALYSWADCIDLAFIAMPAIKCPKLIHDPLKKQWRLSLADAECTRQKIRMIFQVAQRYGHDSLVLSALGCGAYQNPPQHIAQLFKEVITEYATVFKQITFAIYDSKGEGNYQIFRTVLLG